MSLDVGGIAEIISSSLDMPGQASSPALTSSGRGLIDFIFDLLARFVRLFHRASAVVSGVGFLGQLN
jgi:hypothetical protein